MLRRNQDCCFCRMMIDCKWKISYEWKISYKFVSMQANACQSLKLCYSFIKMGISCSKDPFETIFSTLCPLLRKVIICGLYFSKLIYWSSQHQNIFLWQCVLSSQILGQWCRSIGLYRSWEWLQQLSHDGLRLSFNLFDPFFLKKVVMFLFLSMCIFSACEVDFLGEKHKYSYMVLLFPLLFFGQWWLFVGL